MSDYEQNYGRSPRPPQLPPERFTPALLATFGLVLLGIAVFMEANIPSKLALGMVGIGLILVARRIF